MSKRKTYILLLIPILLAITMLFVGCGPTYQGLATRWLASGELETNFYEKTEYEAKPYTKTNNDGLKFELITATVTQTIEGRTQETIMNKLINENTALNYDGYLLTSDVRTHGKYTYAGTEYEFNNQIISNAFIRLSNGGFRPIVSEQRINSTIPEYNYDTKKYSITKYEYSVVKYYNGDSSYAEVRIDSKTPDTLASTTKKFDKLNKNNAPYDNEQLYFMARAMRDAMNTANIVTENGVVPTTLNLKTGNRTITDEATQKSQTFNTTDVNIAVASSGIGKGPGRTLTFIDNTDLKIQHVLYQVHEVMPYSLDSITYTLKTLTTTKPTP